MKRRAVAYAWHVDDRIRMETAGGPDGTGTAGRMPSPMLAGVVTLAVVVFGLVTALGADRAPLDPDTIDPGAELIEPEIEPGFRVVAALDEGPWDPFRIGGAYLYVGDAPTVITDTDEVFEAALPDLEVLFGAMDAGEESIAFGRTPDGPALWRSTDARIWELERLPWDGTVRAAALIDGEILLIGIATDGPSFTYVTATEAAGGWSVSATSRIPDTALHSVPGGFVGRGVATDGDGYGYLYSDNGVDWIYQSDRAAAGSRTAGQIPSFVIETEDTPLLRLPGDGRAFAPPAWPVSGLWLEGDVIWVQTPDAAWSSYDGESWTEFPIDASTGVGNGYSVLLPVGDVARLATSLDDRITLLRWDPGSTRE